MNEQSEDLQQRIVRIAKKSLQIYAQGIVTVESLAEQMRCEWERLRRGEDVPSRTVLTRIAQRLCSRMLYYAWRSPSPEARNRAFQNIRSYLGSSLDHTRYAPLLQHHATAMEDVVHQALETLHLTLVRNPDAGPDDPAAFVKWTQTILIRHAHAYLQKCQRPVCISLEAQGELWIEQYVLDTSIDPLQYVLWQESNQALCDAIIAMRNPRYRDVLLYIYLIGLDEQEVARRLNVPVQDIYLWRHRALKALRKQLEMMNHPRTL